MERHRHHRYRCARQPSKTKPQTVAMEVLFGAFPDAARFMVQPAAFISLATLIPNPDIEGRAWSGCLHCPPSPTTRQFGWSRQKIALHEPPA
jgi:hypothetical protein